MDIVQIVNDIGIQAATLVALMWYVVHQGNIHKEESRLYSEALKANTETMAEMRVAIERLSVLLEKEVQNG